MFGTVEASVRNVREIILVEVGQSKAEMDEGHWASQSNPIESAGTCAKSMRCFRRRDVTSVRLGRVAQIFARLPDHEETLRSKGQQGLTRE